MGRYRKIPLEIEAVQLSWKTWNDVCDMLGEALLAENPEGARQTTEFLDTCGEEGPEYITLSIRTAQDQLVNVRHGEWIVPEAQEGRFYPVAPDVFKKTYEEVEAHA